MRGVCFSQYTAPSTRRYRAHTVVSAPTLPILRTETHTTNMFTCYKRVQKVTEGKTFYDSIRVEHWNKSDDWNQNKAKPKAGLTTTKCDLKANFCRTLTPASGYAWVRTSANALHYSTSYQPSHRQEPHNKDAFYDKEVVYTFFFGKKYFLNNGAP